MTVKISAFANDWVQLLQAYSSNKTFQCSSGKVAKVNNQYKIILSEPSREVLNSTFSDKINKKVKINNPVLTRRLIFIISRYVTDKSEDIDVSEKISQAFDSVTTQLKKRFEAERPSLKSISVRFSQWFTRLWVNRRLLARILIVATFGIFYFLWKRGRMIELRYNRFSYDLDDFTHTSGVIKENVNNKKSKAHLVHSINANKEALPLPVMGIIFNYLNDRERTFYKSWDVAEEAMKAAPFQTEILQKYQKLLSPLRDTFKKEMEKVGDLEEYFKWNPIPIESDYSSTEQQIRLAILSCFGATPDDIRHLRFVSNWIDKEVVEKFKKHHLKYKEFALILVETAPTVLEYVPKDIQGYREIVLAAVVRSSYGTVLNHASDDLKKDKEVVLNAVGHFGCALEYASEDLKKDKEVVLKAVISNGYALQYASEDLRNNKEIVLEAVKSNVSALEYASPELKKDIDVVTAVLESDDKLNRFYNFCRCADGSVLKNKSVLLKAVSLDDKGNMLGYTTVPAEFKKDKEIVYAAVKKCVNAFQFAAEEFKKDQDLILLGLKTSDEALYYAVDELKKNREFIIKAVSVNGYALRWAPEEFRHDPEIVLKGLENDDRALAYTSDKLKNDLDFVHKAIQLQKYAIRFVSDEIPEYKKMVLDILEKEPRVMEFLPEKIKEKPFLIEAIQRNEKVYDHLPKELQTNLEINRAHYDKKYGEGSAEKI